MKAVATVEERRSGVTVVDLGAGTTTMTTYVRGRLVKLQTLTIGGRPLTQHVATALPVPFASAERIKLECATVGAAHVDKAVASTHRFDSGSKADLRQTLDLPLHSTAAMRGALSEIDSPQIDTVLRHVVEHVDAASTAAAHSGLVVLTGGGSQLDGVLGYAARILGRAVRSGRPEALAGIGSMGVPCFAAVSGLVAMAGRPEFGSPQFGSTSVTRRCVA